MNFGGRKATNTYRYSIMKVFICLSFFAITSYATYVGYPYVYRTPLVQNAFYPSSYGFSSLGSPVTVVKPFYPGFYDYRLNLSPSFYPGLYPSSGILPGTPTIIHLIPAAEEEDGDKKKPKKKGKGKGGKDEKDEETTTMSSDKSEDIEKAEKKDESEDEKNDSIEVESV